MDENKLIFTKGNLYGGYPWGVTLGIGWFGSSELHGPFNTQTDANNYGMRQAQARSEVTSVQVCKIETPAVGKLAFDAEDADQRFERDTLLEARKMDALLADMLTNQTAD